MMLFAAVVLLLSFVALAGAVARVTQLASETVQEQDSPLLLEVPNLVDAVDTAIVEMKDDYLVVTSGSPTDAYNDNLTLIMDHLVVHERSRGFIMDWCYVLDSGDYYVQVSLHDGVTRVQIISQQSFTGGSPAPLCP